MSFPLTITTRGRAPSPEPFSSRVTEPAAVVLAVAMYSVAVGYLALHNEKLAVGAAAVGLLAGVIAGNVARLAVVATAGVWLIPRVPGNVSVTDVLIACAGTAALISGAAHAIHPRGHIVLRSFAIYLAGLAITLAYNQDLRSDLEFLHRIALVAGAVWAGAWLVSTGLYRTALRFALAVTLFFATVALADGLRTGFSHPAHPLGYQKNFVGSIVTTVLLVLLAAHKELELPKTILKVSAVVLLGGLFATHSRGALIAAAVGMLIWFFRESGRARGSLRLAAVAAAIGIGIFTAISVNRELNQGTYSSFTQRTQVEQATRDLWRTHPLTGVGLRFFKTPQYAGYQPPNNVFDEVMAEAGVFGLAGFVVFVLGSLIGLGRLRGDLATAGLCVVAARFTHGLFDIYWTGGTTTLPWIIAGMGLASASALAGPDAVLHSELEAD
jgi:O-Antigen ligase